MSETDVFLIFIYKYLLNYYLLYLKRTRKRQIFRIKIFLLKTNKIFSGEELFLFVYIAFQ
jgi:hypothetical protein